ncbi:hypothetical protein K438DRAFT_1773116 [Mycena galopus ATCC 62051]|nr:hypothetical protein K438DRAFT_1773116 [Mycena galopus ATCC 62051]
MGKHSKLPYMATKEQGKRIWRIMWRWLFGNKPPNPGRVVRSYARKAALDPNPTIRSPPADAALYSVDQTTSNAPLPSFEPVLSDFPHQRPRLRAAPQTPEQKLTNKLSAMEELLKNLPVDSIGDFLAILFYNRPHDSPRVHERELMFSATDEAADIRHARPFMSTWATRLVASEARKQVGRGTV